MLATILLTRMGRAVPPCIGPTPLYQLAVSGHVPRCPGSHGGAYAVGRPQLYVRDLPTDPDALLARIRREVARAGSVERRRQAIFTQIGVLLPDNILPREVQAAMYHEWQVAKGTVLSASARAAAAIVDRPGHGT